MRLALAWRMLEVRTGRESRGRAECRAPASPAHLRETARCGAALSMPGFAPAGVENRGLPRGIRRLLLPVVDQRPGSTGFAGRCQMTIAFKARTFAIFL